MTMTLDDYRERAKSNELYNSWWKLCKNAIDNSIKENETKCTIVIPNPSAYESGSFSSTLYEAETLSMIINSINLVYNCNTTFSYSNKDITIIVDWGDNVIPYRKEAN